MNLLFGVCACVWHTTAEADTKIAPISLIDQSSELADFLYFFYSIEKADIAFPFFYCTFLVLCSVFPQISILSFPFYYYYSALAAVLSMLMLALISFNYANLN